MMAATDSTENHPNDDKQESTSSTSGTVTTPSVDEFSPLQQLICSIIPALSFDLHKGQSGRVCVIGGCREYTGAPYFASVSALKVGADLSFVVCTRDAAPIIKSYSPELIVYPNLDAANAIDEICSILPRMHSVVIGPGLGRNERILANVGAIINRVKELQLPMVIDADALFFVSSCPEIVRGYTKAILTPNVAEFDRLYASVYQCEPSKSEDPNASLLQLCQTLGNITIVRKGPQDIISDGHAVVSCTEPGSPRRCGGQGDLLSGSMGTFAYWSQQAFKARNTGDLSLQTYGPNIVAALGACMLTRRCARLAFAKFSRSTTTTELISEIKNAFTGLFPVD